MAIRAILVMSGLTSLALLAAIRCSGDDGADGTATQYHIRYSAAPITETSWDACTPVATVPVPAVAGTEQTVAIDTSNKTDRFRKSAARCWAMLLARIYECFPLRCPKCDEPMRIIAFILEPPVIERLLSHVGEPTAAPEVLPARAPPQSEFPFDQAMGSDDWPEMDQSVSESDETWH